MIYTICYICEAFGYTGMTCYEEKDGDWIVRFYVVKDLDALLTVNNVLKGYIRVNIIIYYIVCARIFILFFPIIYIVFKDGISTC